MKPVYLDNATTTRLDPRILPAMLPFLGDEFGDPRAPHSAGHAALRALHGARGEVARLVGCEPDEVVFTGSATEANNLALKGVLRARGRRRRGLMISAVEHTSVLHPALSLREEGVEVSFLRVGSDARVDPDDLTGSPADSAALVSVLHANPEVGTMQPVKELCRLARSRGALVHTDATLTAGLFPGLWKELEPDLMTLAPHLFHGPKGIGALIVRDGTRLKPEMEGGTQEGGLRGGTPNVALAVGFGEAARVASDEAPARLRRLEQLARQLREIFTRELRDWLPTGDPDHRLPGHVSLCLRFVEGEAVLGLLDDAGILAGSGSACTRGAGKPSHVLQAMGVDPVLARGALEFCFGAFNVATDAERVGRELPPIVERLRALSPLTPP